MNHQSISSGIVAASVIVLMSSRLAVAQDGFADDLTIPEGIEISDPVRFSSVATPKAEDGFRTTILKALANGRGLAL